MAHIRRVLSTTDGSLFYVREGEKDCHTQYGVVKEAELKAKDGSKVVSNTGKEFFVFSPSYADIYKKINGFPIQTTLSIMGQTINTTVTKVEKRSTPPGEFEIPAGYNKVKNEMENPIE